MTNVEERLNQLARHEQQLIDRIAALEAKVDKRLADVGERVMKADQLLMQRIVELEVWKEGQDQINQRVVHNMEGAIAALKDHHQTLELVLEVVKVRS